MGTQLSGCNNCSTPAVFTTVHTKQNIKSILPAWSKNKSKCMWIEKKSVCNFEGEKKIKALKPSFLTVLLLLCLWFFDQIKETSFHGIWPNSSLKVSKKLNQERLLLYLKRKMEKGTYWSKYIFYKRLKSMKYTVLFTIFTFQWWNWMFTLDINLPHPY